MLKTKPPSLPRCLLLLICFAAPMLPAQETDLRATLDNAYARWRRAVEAKDAGAWAGAITMHRQVTTRNLIVSQGLAFPKSVFETALNPAETANLRLLEAQAVGETAHLLYFGKVNVGGDPEQIPDNLLMLKFLQEKGAWKFDSNKIIHLRSQPELLAKLQRGEAPDFLDRPEFTPPGKAPAVPAVCSVPDHISGITLQSIGFETEVKINGFDYFVRDNVLKVFVIGGLQNGENQISLSATPLKIPEGSDRALELDVFTKPSKPGVNGQRVFHYEFTGQKAPSKSKSNWTLQMPATSELSIVAGDE